MGNTSHRKKHKQKLAARKTKIAQGKNSYKKFMKEQIELIQDQIKNNQATTLDIRNTSDTTVSTANEEANPALEKLLEQATKLHDGIK